MANIFHSMYLNQLKRRVDKMSPEEAFRKGKGFRGDQGEAKIICYESAARRGHVEAQYELAGWLSGYWDDLWQGDEEEAQARYWFERAAVQGHLNAQYHTAEYYYTGRGGAKDLAKALYWYEICLPGLKAKNDSWVSKVEAAIRDIRYYHPEVQNQKPASAPTTWTTPVPSQPRASAQPAPSAAKTAAKTADELFQEGVACHEQKRYAKALELFEQAAGMGLKEAQFNCGWMYDEGEGCTSDKKKALYWYEKAAQQENAKAQFICGVMYGDGEGCACDKKKALYWYEKAAQQGDADAQFNCGWMYDNGEGCTSDKKKALYWYEKAAQQGHAKAQFNCSLMYGKGEGCTQDIDKAKYWLKKAADQGDPKAKELLAKF